ncbi:NitT/TauT family transport system ATP-binding protein [Epibacterium ulvae]|uniref:NitT/TauT family transport system ATP-binding protein n=1 Tax=Epibacterium ulvae TaxID=1156985 RepID=A0A1G5RBK5_9RHOB|nr:CmpA/NrtA family ABC transporter substrate-binding protein [Epibacterium ulvae]SCZ71150.1 NitT/TauT family transport system ATP-binding protein [Epibacterium ulvae]
MSVETLRLGYVPLVDAAPYIIAHEIGFAEEEHLALDLCAAPSWSALRDWLAVGQVDAAHMLSVLPVALALGLGRAPAALSALMVTSRNGTVVGVSRALAARMQTMGDPLGFSDAFAAGQGLQRAANSRLRVGVPFPYSMHAELLYYWLNKLGMPAPGGVDVRTIPPPQMSEALAQGEIDAFCVGEPWGSIAVERSVGQLVLPGRAIWSAAPEKVLAVQSQWAEANSGSAKRLVRALSRAGRWLADPSNRNSATEVLSRPEYLGLEPEVLDRALSGAFVISPEGVQRDAGGFVQFDQSQHHSWQGDVKWIGRQLAQRVGLDTAEAETRALSVFREDLYCAAMGFAPPRLTSDAQPNGTFFDMRALETVR